MPKLHELPLQRSTRAQLLRTLCDKLDHPSGAPHHHVSLNASKFVRAQHDPALARALQQADSLGADGVSIVWATQRDPSPVPERVTGCDLAQDLLDEAALRGWAVFLLGAKATVLAQLYSQCTARGIRVVGARDGYFTQAQEPEVVAHIHSCHPDLLLAALGSPKAERFLSQWGPDLGASVIMGVGGTFDVLTGHSPRAPGWAQRAGLEWAWRFAHEPRARFQRAVLHSGRFAAHVARAWISQRSP